IVTIVLVALPAVMLLFLQAGRPGVNPHGSKPKLASVQWGGFDWWCTVPLAASVAALVTLLLARIWWRPFIPSSSTGEAGPTGPGRLPAMAAIWGWLCVGLAALSILAVALTVLAHDQDARQLDRPFRPFAAGFMAPLTLGLAFVTGGIFAAGLNLLLPSLLIGKQFQSTAPAISGISWTQYPLRLPVPTYGFIFASLISAAVTVVLAAAALAWGYQKWRRNDALFVC